MVNVDLSRAKLRWVEFRGLDLDTVRFPDDEDHLILNDYPRSLIDYFRRSLAEKTRHHDDWLLCLETGASGPVKNRRGVFSTRTTCCKSGGRTGTEAGHGRNQPFNYVGCSLSLGT